MAEKEREPILASLEEEKGKQSAGGKGEVSGGLVEELRRLIKLKFLTKKANLIGVDANQVADLAKQADEGEGDEKTQAKEQINVWFGKVMQIEESDRSGEGLAEMLVRNKDQNQAIINEARSVDEIVSAVVGKKNVDRTELESAQQQLEQLAGKLGVEIGEVSGGSREVVERAVDRKMHELREIKMVVELSHQKDDYDQIINKKQETRKRRNRVLETEDFQDNLQENERVYKVKSLVKEAREIEQDTKAFVARVKKDFKGDELERLSEERLADGLLAAMQQEKRALSFGTGLEGADEALYLSREIKLIYANKLIDVMADKALRGGPVGVNREAVEREMRGRSLNEIIAIGMKNRGEWSADKVVNAIGQKLKYRNEASTPRRTRGDSTEIDPLAPDPFTQHGRYRRGRMMQARESIEDLEKNGVDVDRVSILFGEKKREFDRRGIVGKDHREQFSREFMDDLRTIYSGEDEIVLKNMYETANALFGSEHYTYLENRLGEGDYEGYLKYLMSYLYKVGLREGQQDYQLQIMMREARTVLATVGRKDLLDIYEAFEKTAIFHDAYFNLNAEGYAKVLGSWGVDALQVFKNKEANSLGVEVRDLEGNELGSLGIIKYDDMMQSAIWAHRLLYGDKDKIYDEEVIYDDMLVTQLYGSENKICRIKRDSVNGDKIVNSLDNSEIDIESTTVMVDGRKMKLSTLIMDSRYMAGTAHDMWRLDGRIANVLDDVKISSAVGANKGLLSTWKIKSYAEEYGFIPTFMFEALSLDNYIYEVENYKDLVGAGMKKLFKGKNGNGDEVAALLNAHIKRLRVMRGEEFRTNYLPIEDVRLLSRRSMSLEDAKKEFLDRQQLMGNKIVWGELTKEDRESYKKQIGLLQKKWEKNLFNEKEWELIEGIDWRGVNAEYAKILGVESIGNNFEDFIKNFSFGRLSATEKFRGTDLQDFGGYFLKSSEVTKIYKGGFGGGATEALAAIFGTMETYLPYDSSGLRKFMQKEMEVIYSWDDRKFSVEVPKSKKTDNGFVNGDLDGELLPNGEKMMDENGYWVPKMKTEMLYGNSLLGKSRMRRPRNERDIEYAVYSMVGSGIMDRDTAEQFLDSKYGGIFKRWKYAARFYRWVKRWAYLDDMSILWFALWEDGKKSTGEVLKHIFS